MDYFISNTRNTLARRRESLATTPHQALHNALQELKKFLGDNNENTRARTSNPTTCGIAAARQHGVVVGNQKTKAAKKILIGKFTPIIQAYRTSNFRRDTPQAF